MSRKNVKDWNLRHPWISKANNNIESKCIAFLGSKYGLEEWDNQLNKGHEGCSSEGKWGDIGWGKEKWLIKVPFCIMVLLTWFWTQGILVKFAKAKTGN